MIDRKNGLTYADSGVDIDAGNRLVDLIKPMVRATARAGADAEIGGFGGLFDLKAAGFKDPVLVAATDGVGTKVKIAIETGLHGGIGIDLVAMSVNDLVVQGAEPLFFLDYFACGKLDPEAAAAIVAGVAEGCRESGCALIGGETAEMPGLYKDGDYDLAGFAVGAAERGTLLPSADIAVGDAVIGLASSGVHSNGFSLVRKIVEKSGLGFDAPAPFSPVMTLGGALLAPTRLYVKSCLRAIRETGAIKGLAHITGGGFTDNIPRVLPKHLGVGIDLARLPVLPVFKWLAEQGGIAELELLRTFNCGIGMIAIVKAGRDRAGHRSLHRERRDRRAARRGDPGRGRASRGLQRPPRSRAMKRRVAILISGRGSNMAALIEAAKAAGFSGRDRRRDFQPRRCRSGWRRRRRAAFRPSSSRASRSARTARLRGGAAAGAGREECRADLPWRIHAAVHGRIRAALVRQDAQHPSLAAAVVSGPRSARPGACTPA